MIAALPSPTRVQLYDAQDDFVHDDHKWAVFVSGRGAGKTHAGSVKAALRCTKPELGLVAAPNFPMLEHAAKRQFLERLDELGLRYVEHKSLGTLTVIDTGAEVIFATLENESRIRGPNLAWAWADEIEYITRSRVWRALKGAIRAGPNPQLFGTTTPKGRRLVWEEWVRDGGDQHALFTATSFDNPFIDAAGYVASLGYTGQFYAQEIEAKFVGFEGLVYPGFARERHVQRVNCAGWSTVLGLDIGTRNPTFLGSFRHAGERLHLERELYRTGMSSAEIVQATVREYEASQASLVIVDPSAAGLILDLQRAGLRVRKANNDIIVGIQRVTSILESYTCDPSCVSTIAEWESYRYPERQTERDVPLKENDHAMDGHRYVIMHLFRPKHQVRFI